MTSLTDLPFPPENSSGSHMVSDSGERDPLGRIASLDPFLYQEMRPCADCGGDQIFMPIYECDAGRVGLCLGCGAEKLIRFTRECAA